MTQLSRGRELDELRREVERVDRELIEVLSRRQSLIHELAQSKRDRRRPLYDAAQEAAVMARYLALCPADLPASVVRTIARELMSGAIRAQGGVIVGYAGGIDSPGARAARGVFGSAAVLVGCPGSEDVIDTVASDRHYGVIELSLDNLLLVRRARRRVCRTIVSEHLAEHVVVSTEAARRTGTDELAIAVDEKTCSGARLAARLRETKRVRLSWTRDAHCSVLLTSGHPDDPELSSVLDRAHADGAAEVIGAWPCSRALKRLLLDQ